MSKIIYPKIKKTVNGFLLNEEGKITKNKLVRVGIFSILGVLTAKTVFAGHDHLSAHANINVVGNIKHANLSSHCEDDHVHGSADTGCAHGSKHCKDGGDVTGGGTKYAEYIHHENSIEIDDSTDQIKITHAHIVDKTEISAHANEHGHHTNRSGC